MHKGIRIVAVWIAAAIALPAFAADNPWFGTWKLDTAKSHMTGATFTYTKGADGMDEYSDGAVSFKFTANGIDYPVFGGTTMNWVATGPNEWKETDKQNGTVTGTSDIKLTPDCKTMTTTSTANRPDGTTSHDVSVATKVKGEGCLEGTWKNTKATVSAPSDFVISQGSSADAWKWENRSWKQTVEGKPDGTDLAISGPTVPSGMTVAFKADGARKITVEVKVNGKVIGQGEQVLAPNGKTFTETDWTPGKENEKQTYVYNKQS